MQDVIWLTVGEAAEMLRCSERTIYRMIDDGLLTASRKPPRGCWLIERASIMRSVVTVNVKVS